MLICYLGGHTTKQAKEMRCRGITRSGVQCGLVAVGTDCYCARHVLTRMPTVPAAIDWPSSTCLEGNLPRHPVRWIKTTMDTASEQGVPLKPYQFLMLTLVLLKHPELSNKLQTVIDGCMDKMATVPHLAHFREYFGRKLSMRHRAEARARYKAYVHRTVTASELGIDIADVVTYLVDKPRPSPY